ncbi:unnamed protein product [Pocillopora meandrina]|uniref:Uncharacterized protein n=1 Tax=Pocillopora meandrina TaxID=46732 RepID=A0AAU9VQD0_9CNID|nr:unnamed protein product [Pocillopora meandrina]
MNTIQMAGFVFYVMLSITLSSSSPLERIKRSLGAGDCPPGVWTCLAETRDYRMIEEPNQENFAVGVDNVAGLAAACPPGVWTCVHFSKRQAAKRKTMLEKMSKQRRRVQRSVKNCPPGIWVC